MLLAVLADDRSGAMESAAACADAGLVPTVVPWDVLLAVPRERIDTESAARTGQECLVVDLRTRAFRGSATERASERMSAAIAALGPGTRIVHKIDSTLRGTWAVEIAALVATGRRVLLVPAYPAAGRTCVDGVVRVDGVPVAETEFARDPSHPVRSSRPADALAGVVGVTVADARTDADIEQVVESAGDDPHLVISGPAAVVGAVARRVTGASGRRPSTPLVPPGDVLVVCGSRHLASRVQAAAVCAMPGTTLIEPPSDLVAEPEIVALELAVRAHDHLAARDVAVVVLLGGDTADAFLGDRAVRVLGSVGVGMALGTVSIDGRSLTIVTKPGGFGGTNALVDLLAGRDAR